MPFCNRDLVLFWSLFNLVKCSFLPTPLANCVARFVSNRSEQISGTWKIEGSNKQITGIFTEALLCIHSSFLKIKIPFSEKKKEEDVPKMHQNYTLETEHFSASINKRRFIGENFKVIAKVKIVVLRNFYSFNFRFNVPIQYILWSFPHD